jgi:hypothetical protein
MKLFLRRSVRRSEQCAAFKEHEEHEGTTTNTKPLLLCMKPTNNKRETEKEKPLA